MPIPETTTSNNDHLNKDELEAPKWMNKDFFTKVLHSCEKDEFVKLKDFKISPATVKGDHYASVMFRANVEYVNAKGQTRSISMIIKTMPEIDGFKKDILKESYIFETEIAMYAEVLPKFEAMLREIGDDTILGARCLYYSLEPIKFIVFEDIVPLGYTMLRDRKLNLEETKVAFRKLAKWHAVSYKINQENPATLDALSHDFLEMVIHDKSNFIAGGIELFTKMLDTQPSLVKYKRYFEAMQPNLIDKCTASFREYRQVPHKDAHYVLCHGDFHCLNMMFKHSAENQLEDIMFLDFQMSYIGPMVNDIMYAFYMMTNKQLRLHHKDELIHYYFSNFAETLERLGYKGKMPTLKEFRQMLLRHAHIEIFFLVTFLPMWYALEDEPIEPDEMMESEDYRKTFYLNKNYLAELEECLPKYLHMGYLEN